MPLDLDREVRLLREEVRRLREEVRSLINSRQSRVLGSREEPIKGIFLGDGSSPSVAVLDYDHANTTHRLTEVK